MKTDFIMSLLAETTGAVDGTKPGGVEFWALIFTVVSGIATAGWAVWVWRGKLRWDQAKLARAMLDEIFDDKPSNDAWRMVDGETSYKDQDKVKLNINMNDVRQALPRPWSDETGGAKVYVRWCFDDLFYYLERLEQSLKSGFIQMDDVRASTTYYIRLMARDKELFKDYATFIGFAGAIAFMDRFPEWRDPVNSSIRGAPGTA